jgi:hypothetical protein
LTSIDAVETRASPWSAAAWHRFNIGQDLSIKKRRQVAALQRDTHFSGIPEFKPASLQMRGRRSYFYFVFQM